MLQLADVGLPHAEAETVDRLLRLLHSTPHEYSHFAPEKTQPPSTLVASSMAFPIPTHLPKKQDSRDVSTQVLTKIAETPYKSLKGDLAASWVSELDETIRTTKVRFRPVIVLSYPS